MISVKFADPSNPSVVWDRMIEPMPEWIRAHLASGHFLNDWLIKEKTAPIDLKPLRNSDTSVKTLRNYQQTDWVSDNCPVCMNPLPRNETGRPPVHCSNACKCKAYRQRNDVTRNLQLLNKTTRNSTRKKATVTYIGESGTILKAPVSTSSASTHNESPVMRTFADFVDFLAG